MLQDTELLNPFRTTRSLRQLFEAFNSSESQKPMSVGSNVLKAIQFFRTEESRRVYKIY